MPSTSPQSAAAATAAASDHTPQAPLCLDEGTFVGFVEAHYEWLFRYAKSKLGSDADAEDAVQSCFGKIWKSIKSNGSKPVENPGGYATTCMKRTLVDISKKRSRDLPSGSSGQIDDFALDSAASEAFWQAQHNAPPLEALEDAISKMPDVERRALELKYRNGLSSAEIAVRFGKSKLEDSHEAKERAGNRLLKPARTRLAKILLGYE